MSSQNYQFCHHRSTAARSLCSMHFRSFMHAYYTQQMFHVYQNLSIFFSYPTRYFSVKKLIALLVLDTRQLEIY